MTNLTDKDFSNFDGKKLKLTNADLTNSILDRIDLRDSDLSGSILIDTKIRYAIANKLKIQKAQSVRTDLSFSDLKSATINENTFSHCIALELDLSNSSIRNTTFEHSNFTRCDFSRCILHNSTIFLSILKYSVWTDSELENSNFREVNFFKAKINRGKFNEIKIIKSNISETIIEGTEFTSVNFSEINFSNTLISNCTFINVSFNKCNFANTVFRNTEFRDVDLNLAIFSNTTIAGCDISKVIGLESIKHLKPSSIGIDTIFRSDGKVPRKFLQECGLQEILIDYIPSLVASSDKIIVDYYSCFLSHSHEDKIFVRKIFEYFKEHKIRCWLDEKQILPGDDIYDSVDKGIRLWDKFIVCLSKTSLNSYWVEKEIEKVLQKEEYFFKTHMKKVNLLIPINIDNYINQDEFIKQGKKYESDLRKRNIADFTKWNDSEMLFKTELDRVVRALQTSGNYEDPPISKL